MLLQRNRYRKAPDSQHCLELGYDLSAEERTHVASYGRYDVLILLSYIKLYNYSLKNIINEAHHFLDLQTRLSNSTIRIYYASATYINKTALLKHTQDGIHSKDN